MIKIKINHIFYERPLYYNIIIGSLDTAATRGCTGESASVTVANCRYCGNIVNSYSFLYAVCIYYVKKNHGNNNMCSRTEHYTCAL